jgi:hypothetical protein
MNGFLFPFILVYEAAGLNTLQEETKRLLSKHKSFTPEQRLMLKSDIADTTCNFLIVGQTIQYRQLRNMTFLFILMFMPMILRIST